ncbi:7721_t:CDS:2, partial [Cetraspora pellucida]
SVKTHMPRIYTLSDIGKGSKLGDIPSSRYLPSRTELENQLAYKDNKRIQRDLKQSNNDKEKLSKHTYQLINEGDSLSHKSLAKYFKSKTLPIITNNQNSESLIQDITNKQNPESLIQDITNKQNLESLIQDITIKET